MVDAAIGFGGALLLLSALCSVAILEAQRIGAAKLRSSHDDALRTPRPTMRLAPHEDRAFLGHPKGLGFLGFTEACERFSYYSMQTLLVLYMVNYLLLPGRMEHVVGLSWVQTHLYHGIAGQPLASAIFGTYTALVYLTPILGGIIADKWLGRRRDSDRRRNAHGDRPFPDGHPAGASSSRSWRWSSASGLFKGNIATQVGELYGPNDLRRAMAFQIFYIFINVSVIVAPLDLRHARPEGRLALRVRLRRRGDGARPLHLLFGRRYLPTEELAAPD